MYEEEDTPPHAKEMLWPDLATTLGEGTDPGTIIFYFRVKSVECNTVSNIIKCVGSAVVRYDTLHYGHK